MSARGHRWRPPHPVPNPRKIHPGFDKLRSTYPVNPGKLTAGSSNLELVKRMSYKHRGVALGWGGLIMPLTILPAQPPRHVTSLFSMIFINMLKKWIKLRLLFWLFFVICGFIKNFLPNSYLILQIYHAKSFKMRHVTSLYFNFSVRYS